MKKRQSINEKKAELENNIESAGFHKVGWVWTMNTEKMGYIKTALMDAENFIHQMGEMGINYKIREYENMIDIVPA